MVAFFLIFAICFGYKLPLPEHLNYKPDTLPNNDRDDLKNYNNNNSNNNNNNNDSNSNSENNNNENTDDAPNSDPSSDPSYSRAGIDNPVVELNPESMNIGQKILKGFEDLKHQGSSTTSCTESHLPGKSVVHDDEYNLAHQGTYPRLCPLSDGSILVGYTQFDKLERSLQVARSTDGGKNFVPYGEVTKGTGDVDNMFLLEVAPNQILAAFRNHDAGPGGPQYFRITVCGSNDNGKTWAFFSQAAEKGPPLGLWEPFMRVSAHGEVHLTYSQEFAHDDQRTMLVTSNDGGHTWAQPRCVAGYGERLRDGMNGIAHTNDNGRPALVMVVETTRYGTFNVEGAVSYDDGFTWSARHELYVPPRGHNAGAPQIASFADGSLAVVFMTDEDSSTVQWVQNAAIKVVFSGPPKNGQLQWTKPMRICKGSSFWPGVTAIAPDRILVTYDCGGPKRKTITWHPK